MADETPGAILRRKRKGAGLSITELARRCGVSKQALQRYEMDMDIPRDAIRKALLRALRAELKRVREQATAELARCEERDIWVEVAQKRLTRD